MSRWAHCPGLRLFMTVPKTGQYDRCRRQLGRLTVWEVLQYLVAALDARLRSRILRLKLQEIGQIAC